MAVVAFLDGPRVLRRLEDCGALLYLGTCLAVQYVAALTKGCVHQQHCIGGMTGRLERLLQQLSGLILVLSGVGVDAYVLRCGVVRIETGLFALETSVTHLICSQGTIVF